MFAHQDKGWGFEASQNCGLIGAAGQSLRLEGKSNRAQGQRHVDAAARDFRTMGAIGEVERFHRVPQHLGQTACKNPRSLQ